MEVVRGRFMPTMIADDVYLEIPAWVTDLASFRRWTDEPDFPEKGNIWGPT